MTKYQLLPPLSADELDRLTASIRERGVQVPVLVDEDGEILDGHHRAMIADSLGIDYPTQRRGGLEDFEKRLLAVSLNIDRRQLTDTEQAHLGGVIEPDIAEQARARQEELGRTHGVDPLATTVAKGRTVDDVARAVGLGSGRTYERARRVLAEGLALGVVTPDQLRADRPPDVPPPPPLRAIRRQVNAARQQAQRNANQALTQQAPRLADIGETFATIVLDPPWDWGDEGDVNQFGRARPPYDTMSIDAIAELPVGKVAEQNAHIYLWITNRSLPKGFALLTGWGFRYVTMLTWVKPHFGMGNYFRGQTEHVLFGVRGSLPLLRRDRGTVVAAPRGGPHSAKPDAFYQLVQECSPGPWLEMFARGTRPGWVGWGAEA